MKNIRSDKKRSAASKHNTQVRKSIRAMKYGSPLRATFAAGAR